MRKYIYYSILSLTLASCARNPLTKAMADPFCYSLISKDYIPKDVLEDMEETAALSLIEDHKISIGSAFSLKQRNVRFISDVDFDKIDKITICYAIEKKVEKEEARKIFIDVLEKFIACVNAEERFKDYLIDRKFTRKNIELSIDFWVENQGYFGCIERYDHPYIASALNTEADEILYLFYDNKKKEYRRDNRIVEPYEIDKEMVLTEQSSEKQENPL